MPDRGLRLKFLQPIKNWTIFAPVLCWLCVKQGAHIKAPPGVHDLIQHYLPEPTPVFIPGLPRRSLAKMGARLCRSLRPAAAISKLPLLPSSFPQSQIAHKNRVSRLFPRKNKIFFSRTELGHIPTQKTHRPSPPLDPCVPYVLFKAPPSA